MPWWFWKNDDFKIQQMLSTYMEEEEAKDILAALPYSGGSGGSRSNSTKVPWERFGLI